MMFAVAGRRASRVSRNTPSQVSVPRNHFSKELDGVVLTYKPDLEFWKMNSQPQDPRIRDFTTTLANGKPGLEEDFFEAPQSRLGKPLEETEVIESSWVYQFLENGNLDKALSQLEKQGKVRLHDYEILLWGLIGLTGTPASIQKLFSHAQSRVPLTTTFLGQVMEAFVAVEDFASAQKLFDEAQSKYKLPQTQELLHKYLGLFQLNKQYSKQVAEVRKRFAQVSRQRDFSDLKAKDLEEVDPILFDPALNVPADKEREILKNFAQDYLIQASFDQGMKQWRQRLDNYVQWHKGEENSALEELNRDNTQLMQKYARRNAQIKAFFEKKFALGKQ